MSGFARSETANLVSATSGTERECGFVGILPCRSDPCEQTPDFHKKLELLEKHIRHFLYIFLFHMLNK